mgnify:CR=1 FL=1
MAENRGYMQRYAMLFGTYMGGFWILKFILFPVGLSVPFLLFLFMGLTLCVPFMGYYYARMYRNQVCGGGISFLHAWVFTVFIVYVCRAACRRGTLHLLQVHRPRICDKHVRNDGRHACPKATCREWIRTSPPIRKLWRQPDYSALSTLRYR